MKRETLVPVYWRGFPVGGIAVRDVFTWPSQPQLPARLLGRLHPAGAAEIAVLLAG